MTRTSLKEQLLKFDQIQAEADNDSSSNSSSTIYIYKMFIAREKALYQNLNMMKWQN